MASRTALAGNPGGSRRSYRTFSHGWAFWPTLVIAGTRVRLWGIRALPAGQVCTGADGRAYGCGRLATLTLDAVTRERTIACRVLGEAGAGLVTARCVSGSRDVAGILVLMGRAIDVPAHSGGAYQPEQRAAIARRAGVWADPIPWPVPAEPAAP